MEKEKGEKTEIKISCSFVPTIKSKNFFEVRYEDETI